MIGHRNGKYLVYYKDILHVCRAAYEATLHIVCVFVVGSVFLLSRSAMLRVMFFVSLFGWL